MEPDHQGWQQALSEEVLKTLPSHCVAPHGAIPSGNISGALLKALDDFPSLALEEEDPKSHSHLAGAPQAPSPSLNT